MRSIYPKRSCEDRAVEEHLADHSKPWVSQTLERIRQPPTGAKRDVLKPTNGNEYEMAVADNEALERHWE